MQHQVAQLVSAGESVSRFMIEKAFMDQDLPAQWTGETKHIVSKFIVAHDPKLVSERPLDPVVDRDRQHNLVQLQAMEHLVQQRGSSELNASICRSNGKA
jgi:hypothetical protein